MKRRYKAGDWFRVPLPARSDALGIITHACRSRLFGYFFAAPEGDVSFDALKRLTTREACARFLFGGEPLELLRWPLVATSLTHDQTRWPFPQFAHRGAFGREWTVREYDPQTLQVSAQQKSDAQHASTLPAAHFLRPPEAEELLAHAIDRTLPPPPSVICELRTPVDVASLEPLAAGGCVQISQAIAREEAALLGGVLRHPYIELRVHDVFGEPFDCAILRGWSALHALALDTTNIANVEAIDALAGLRRLRLPAGCASNLAGLNLDELFVRGDGGGADLRRMSGLESLTLENVQVDPATMPRATICGLTLRHCEFDLKDISALPQLERLELQGGAIEDISPLAATQLRALTLNGVRLLRDLEPLASARHLRILHLQAMPQLRPADFAPLAAGWRIQVTVDSGNRTVDREIQRLFIRERIRK